MSKSQAKYVGVDGCPCGWLTIGLDDGDDYEVKVFVEFHELVEYYSEACLILVDIPIGLPRPGPEPRNCDTEARKKLGSPRSSSVFRVPIREVAYMVSEGISREEADRRSRSSNSKGIGAQAFNIMGKIAEVDKALVAREKSAFPSVREAHPEVCFWGLNRNSAMSVNKKKQGGIEERVSVLQCIEPRTQAIHESALSKYPRGEVARDDILDALATAVTAKLAFQDSYKLKTLPESPPTDSKGLPMEMVYVEADHGPS